MWLSFFTSFVDKKTTTCCCYMRTMPLLLRHRQQTGANKNKGAEGPSADEEQLVAQQRRRDDPAISACELARNEVPTATQYFPIHVPASRCSFHLVTCRAGGRRGPRQRAGAAAGARRASRSRGRGCEEARPVGGADGAVQLRSLHAGWVVCLLLLRAPAQARGRSQVVLLI